MHGLAGLMLTRVAMLSQKNLCFSVNDLGMNSVTTVRLRNSSGSNCENDVGAVRRELLVEGQVIQCRVFHSLL